MIRSLGRLFTTFAHRFMPHPFVFALLLTVLTLVLGLTWGRSSPRVLLTAWYEGIWTPGLMVFALQMALILITGHALAMTPPVRRGLDRLAGAIHGTAGAVMVTALAAMLAALLNWGLGLIVGALLAREIGTRARRSGLHIHYPLVVAAGYTGLLVWHGGFSGSAPLSVATTGHPLVDAMGILPISGTILSPLNLVVTGFLLVAVPLLLVAMLPPANRREEAPLPPRREFGTEQILPTSTPADRLDRSRVLVSVIVLLAGAYLVRYALDDGWGAVNLNSIIFLFLTLGLALHGSPRRYANAVDEAVGGAGGILLQFPFYFGIMGMMRGAGLVEKMAELSVGVARSLAEFGLEPAAVHAVMTFFSAAVVNVFVPSGGGQWAVQGPIAVEAARELGLNLQTTVMALAYGDQLTNMLQPFWALPLLAITGLQARQIVGYTALLMLLVTPPLVLLIAVFAA